MQVLCQEQTNNVKRKPKAPVRKPRADSARNRQLLNDAAKAAFAEVGLKVDQLVHALPHLLKTSPAG